jgi:hypothetical protein
VSFPMDNIILIYSTVTSFTQPPDALGFLINGPHGGLFQHSEGPRKRTSLPTTPTHHCQNALRRVQRLCPRVEICYNARIFIHITIILSSPYRLNNLVTELHS